MRNRDTKDYYYVKHYGLEIVNLPDAQKSSIKTASDLFSILGNQSLTNYEDEDVDVEEKGEEVSPELIIIRNNLLRNVISN